MSQFACIIFYCHSSFVYRACYLELSFFSFSKYFYFIVIEYSLNVLITVDVICKFSRSFISSVAFVVNFINFLNFLKLFYCIFYFIAIFNAVTLL